MKLRKVALSGIFVLALASCREDDITGTVKQCKEIDAKMTAYKLKKIVLPESKDEGGSVSIFTQEQKLVLTTDTAYTSAGTSSARYYFDNGDLICVVQNEYVYNQPIYMTREHADSNQHEFFDPTKTVLKTNRFYFYNGRMVKWINENNIDVSSENKRYDLQQAILQKDAEKIKKMAREDRG